MHFEARVAGDAFTEIDDDVEIAERFERGRDVLHRDERCAGDRGDFVRGLDHFDLAEPLDLVEVRLALGVVVVRDRYPRHRLSALATMRAMSCS